MKNEYKLIRGFSAPDEERSVDSAREKIFRCVARDRTMVPGHHHHGGDGDGGDDDDFMVIMIRPGQSALGNW